MKEGLTPMRVMLLAIVFIIIIYSGVMQLASLGYLPTKPADNKIPPSFASVPQSTAPETPQSQICKIPKLNLENFGEKVMTGPRTHPIPPKSLVVIVAGEAGKTLVDEAMKTKWQDRNKWTVMLFHYDMSDWTKLDWYPKIISIRYPDQMKWWYIKRFVTPALVDAYEYVWFFDEDVVLNELDPPGYLEFIKKHNIHLSQAAAHKDSERSNHKVTFTPAIRPRPLARWVDFVECGPMTVISRDAYQGCIYDFLMEDIAVGWGIDTRWHYWCSRFGFNRTAIIDKYQVLHVSLKTSWSASSRGIKMEPGVEWKAVNERYKHIPESKSLFAQTAHFGVIESE